MAASNVLKNEYIGCCKNIEVDIEDPNRLLQFFMRMDYSSGLFLVSSLS